MGKFDKVKSTAFNELQKEAGMILTKFDLTGATEIQDEDIVFVTKGGINPYCTPTFEDWGADIDNCPEGTIELMETTGWDCGIKTTALNITAESIAMALGSADISKSGNVSTIKPRKVKAADAKDLYWVAPLTNGGFAACKIKNALSTAGLSIQTTKKGKGELSVEIKGHFSLNDTDDVPMEYYISDGEE